MKIHLDLPWGGTFDFERQPSPPDQFYALCWLAGGGLLAWVVVTLLGG